MLSRWLVGSVYGTNWRHVFTLLPYLFILIPIALSRAGNMDVLVLGDELATGLGLKVERERRLLLFLAVALSAACIAVCGGLYFVGLVSPHIAKRIFSAKHHFILPASALIGMLICVMADSVGRAITQSVELPVGIIVSVISAPYFPLSLAQANLYKGGICHSNRINCGETLRWIYRGTFAFYNLNLSIPAHKITSLIGANGSGKIYSFLKAMTRLIPIKHGAVYLDGQSIYQMRTRDVAQKLAILPQNSQCPDGLSVEELVANGRFPYRKGMKGLTEEDNRIIRWAMESCNISDFSFTRCRFSVRRATAACLDCNGTGTKKQIFYFLDEPTTFLDIAHQLDIMHLLVRLNKQQGVTIVMVLHDLNHAAMFSDNIVAISNGTKYCEGSLNR